MAYSLYKKPHFEQHMSQRNESLKNRLASIHISTAKGILMSPPFCYSENISREISDGIVNYADKLMSNAMADSDDEDDEMIELNQMGDDFQAMVDTTLLLLIIDDKASHQKVLMDTLQRLYPVPKKAFHISRATTPQFYKGLEEMRSYLKTRAFLGFSATIALVGDYTEDGAVFGGQQTVPLGVIENQIKSMMEARGKQLAPMVVDLITVTDGQLFVSTIKANDDDVERYCIQS